MKKYLYIFIMAFTLIASNSCKKSGSNPLSSYKNLGIGSYLVLDSTINLNFDYSKINTSAISVIVSGYPGSKPVDHIDLFVTADATYDTTKWHLVKTFDYSGDKTELTVTGAELGKALGTNPATFTPGSSYTFYTRIITKDGHQYDVNNSGDNSGSGLLTGAYYYSAFILTAYITCPYTGGMTGSFTVMEDGWADWSVGDVVQVTQGSGSNQLNLSQVYPNPSIGTVIKPLIATIDPATGAATVTATEFGDYGGDKYAASGKGYVFSCTGQITITFDFSDAVSGSDIGLAKLVLQKQ